MTGREAIEIAKKAVIVAKQQRQNEADDEENEWFDSNIEGLKQAEKDLELLEDLLHLILCIEETFNQKYFDGKGYTGTIFKDYFIDNDLTGRLEERLKLKERLENDE